MPKQDLVSTPIAKIDWLLTASPSYLALQDEDLMMAEPAIEIEIEDPDL